jgi:hypothetical protein
MKGARKEGAPVQRLRNRKENGRPARPATDTRGSTTLVIRHSRKRRGFHLASGGTLFPAWGMGGIFRVSRYFGGAGLAGSWITCFGSSRSLLCPTCYSLAWSSFSQRPHVQLLFRTPVVADIRLYPGWFRAGRRPPGTGAPFGRFRRVLHWPEGGLDGCGL